MQAQVPAQNMINVPLPPTPEEPQPLAPDKGDQFVDIVGVEADIAPPAAPEIDMYAHENLEGFDIDMEDNLGEAPMENHHFAWANANADGLDPQGYGPMQQWGEVEQEGEEEEEDPEEMEGNSGVSTSASYTSYTSSDPGPESESENSVNQAPPVAPLG